MPPSNLGPPPLTLLQVTADTLPALQELYEASGGYFRSHSGAAARPEEAAITYSDVLEAGDRVLLGIWWQRETLIGCLDLRFDHPSPGIVWFGALILRDELPAGREEMESWAVRILEEYLRIGSVAQEIRLSLLVSDRTAVRFWSELGYAPGVGAIRHFIGGKSQRFITYRKPIYPVAQVPPT